MAIKDGYKQTELGVIPEDWEVIKLGQYADISKLAGFEYSKYFNSYKDGGDIIVIRGINITKNELNLTDVRYIPRSTSFFLKRSQLHANDLVFAYVGTIGPVFLILEDNKFHLGPNTCRITVSKRLSPQYAFTYFKSMQIIKEINEFISIGAQPSLSMTKIRQFKLVLPLDLSEQIAIATALSDIDALITAMDKKIAKKKLIKQGTMQQLLTGKKRLPGFSEEWVEKKLGEVVQFERGQMITSSQFIHGNIPVIAGGKTPAGFHNINNRKANVITISASGANAGYVAFHTNPIFASDCSTISENYAYNLKFIYYLLQSKQEDIYKAQTGGAQPHIHPQNIEPFELLVPPTKSEQTAIAQILSDMDNEIAALEAKRDKYKQLKAGMMQELLTGKIRLVESVNKSQKAKVIELKPEKKSHNDQINEAVVISFLVHKFGTIDFPLSRFRYTKYAYLLHRQYEHETKGFQKHAAGPYKPTNRYKGPENIAVKNKYIGKVGNPKSGKDAFITNENIEKALNYFTEWYGINIQQWIEQFRYYKNEDLEVLTTVDESICDLEKQGKQISVNNIKAYIHSIPQWKDKLDKPCFSDLNIQKAINESYKLFGEY